MQQQAEGAAAGNVQGQVNLTMLKSIGKFKAAAQVVVNRRSSQDAAEHFSKASDRLKSLVRKKGKTRDLEESEKEKSIGRARGLNDIIWDLADRKQDSDKGSEDSGKEEG